MHRNNKNHYRHVNKSHNATKTKLKPIDINPMTDSSGNCAKSTFPCKPTTTKHNFNTTDDFNKKATAKLKPHANNLPQGTATTLHHNVYQSKIIIDRNLNIYKNSTSNSNLNYFA